MKSTKMKKSATKRPQPSVQRRKPLAHPPMSRAVPSKNIHGSVSEKEICRIVHLRNRYSKVPAAQIRELYQRSYGESPSATLIKRILDQCGMQEPVARSADSAGGIGHVPKVTAPNDVWTIDFNPGWYNHPGTSHPPLILRDEFSRFVVAARMLPDLRTKTLRALFEEIFGAFRMPKTICCRKSAPFGSNISLCGLTKLSAWWLALGINVEWKCPGRMREPRWLEQPRVHLGFAWKLQSTEERQEAVDAWRDKFNRSPLLLLNDMTPSALLGKQPAAMRVPAVEIEYPSLVRRLVHKTGIIRFNGRTCFLSSALAGWDVSLTEREDGFYDVHFARLTLGILDPKKVEFTAMKSSRVSIKETQPTTESNQKAVRVTPSSFANPSPKGLVGAHS